MWKFVPDPRTICEKDLWPKVFCFDGGYRNRAVDTGRKELPRWCVNPGPRGPTMGVMWSDLETLTVSLAAAFLTF